MDACSNAASWSTSLMIRRPSRGSTRRSLAFSTRPPAAVSRRSSSTMNAGPPSATGRRTASSRSRPTRLPGPIPSPARISPRGRDRSRGCSGRLKSWNRWRFMASGAAPAVPQHSLPTRIAGGSSGPRTSIASSNRGSNPVRNDRLALCSRSAYTTSRSYPRASARARNASTRSG